MNRAQARKIVRQQYGPGANVVNVSSKDKNQRFGVVIFIPGGALDHPSLGCLGYGCDYQSAVSHANQNPTAQAIAKEWIQTKKDYEEFRVDPVGYKKRKTEQMAAVLSKQNADMANL